MPQLSKVGFHPSQTTGDALPSAEELLRVIVEEAADYAFIILDREGCIRRWNPGAELLFGYSADEIVTRHFSILFTAEDVDAAIPESELQQATECGKALDRRWHVRRDGTRFFADGITTALRNDGGEIIGFVKLARDVTVLQAADEDRRRMLIREQQLNREKDDFFAAVSHELRTPLTAISGWLELLEHNRGDEEMLRDGIAVMQQATASLSKLVDDLLDAVRTRTGKMRVDAKPTDLAAVVTEAIHAFRLAFEAKQLTVHEVLDPGVVVIGDATRLHQVMWNLVSNAIRHNVPGGVVDVSLRRAGTEAVIEVRDTGEGIDPALLPYIFEPFRQHAGARSGGLGLGLAIARSLIEIHGGAIEAESEGVGRGATFRVRLPLLAA
jgi:PAS domain S-box-containing protein